MSEKTSTGRLVAAIAGIILIVSLFLKWYGAPDQVNQFAQAAGVGDIGANAFQATDLGGIFLLITGIIAIIPAALDIFDLEIELPVAPGLVILVLGVIGVLWVLLRIVDTPGAGGINLSLKFGIFISLLAAAGVAFGGFLQKGEDEASGEYDQAAYAAPPAAAPPAAAPPAAAPPAPGPPPAAAPPAYAPPPAQAPPAPPAPPAPQAPPPSEPPAPPAPPAV